MKKKATIFFIFLLVSSLVAQESKKQTAANQEIAAGQTPANIPITEIPTRADEAHLALNKIREILKPVPAIIAIEKHLPVVLDSLQTLRPDSLFEQLNSMPLRRLQNLQREWSITLKRLDEVGESLSTRSRALGEQTKLLQSMAREWKATAAAIDTVELPQPIRERVTATIVEIDTLQARLDDRIKALLVYQNRISKQQIAINELLDLINDAEAELRTQLFVRDSPPLLEAFQTIPDSLHLGDYLKESWDNFSRTMSNFTRANKNAMNVHLFLFVLLLAVMLYFNKRNKQQKLFNEDDNVLRASAFFISRPFSAALLVSLFLSIWLYPNATVTIGELLIIIFLIALLRLMSGVIVPERRKAVYVLAALYVFAFIHNNVVGFLLLQRVLLMAITLATIGLLIWVIRSAYPLKNKEIRPWPGLLFRLMPIAVLFLIISLVANFIGSVTLAHVITVGIIKSIMVAVLLYTIARVLDGLTILMIRKRASKGLQVVRTYEHQMEHWAVIAIHLIAFLIWVRATLRGFRLLQPLQEWFANILATQWAFGTVVVSVENIFDFFLTLVLTMVLTRLARVFLDLEVFPRVRLPRGIPGAISMVVRYTIVAVGIFLAVSSLGLDLGKFGLLAGAMGVGLGFGLQNVIANFVSGLILAFERPIQVGDKVEVGNVLGNVKQIGVRSSTIKTFDGSEVIVPNADFISQQVTNWTLSDARQRIKLPVKVAFDSDPEQILEILLKIAEEHPGALTDPAPVATFNGFGDYFLDFTLYFWVSENIFQYKTEVAIKVHRSLKEAGIDKPRPQQDLYLRMIDSLDKLQKSQD